MGVEEEVLEREGEEGGSSPGPPASRRQGVASGRDGAESRVAHNTLLSPKYHTRCPGGNTRSQIARQPAHAPPQRAPCSYITKKKITCNLLSSESHPRRTLFFVACASETYRFCHQLLLRTTWTVRPRHILAKHTPIHTAEDVVWRRPPTERSSPRDVIRARHARNRLKHRLR